ncbi:heavy metal translocating P-type ATPase [Enterococcus haemoperoxidus ATCC BAA-382]|uniref:Cd(2+)-exporting ATPase n=1 Tax=Enterococcus haemoperoxidus ATCC BAA-382 TaxID=1158608 RepID=R2SGY6_9ENTE|nr:heavy metal translocating P-type ATPase [Enterococcus haemoperoxidus]EOH92141.1 heavy metal translocating P-type ATPase [Enterococcus haemoperoxidus ATCC BAA-382]EOT61826.1 cadmium-translocating P-type ATPase [Enterococcus haemoperoxidus ATCC BAA-382]OJG53902.1 heavy metal translocating P-type ATPase [Enterococcus haemoperoxidus]
MKHLTKLIITIITGILALVFEFIFQQPTWAFGIIVITGSVMAFSMLVEMVKTLKSGKYGVDILAITAIIATLAVREYWASLMILIMLTGGDSLEDYAAKKANKELRALLDNSPQKAHQSINGTLIDIMVEKVAIGDDLLVKPGEIVPVDGRVTKGVSVVDESSLTGESQPVNKKIGDSLMSGSINGDSSLTMKAEKSAADSQYQTIVKLVKESEAQPARFVRMADRYAVPFTITAYVIAGAAWFISKDPTRFAEVLVVASPCPLILAAPIALVAGMSRSSRNGIVVKTGTTLEKMAEAKSVAFDKTGTITKGVLSVDKIVSTSEISADNLLILAASAEQESSHILARSLVSYASSSVLKKVSELEEVTGSGVKAIIDGKIIRVGKPTFVSQQKIEEVANQTIIYISQDNHYLGYITFTDSIRPEAKETMNQLRNLQVNHLLMLTGDHQQVADDIAKKVGISVVYAECLPQDKIDVLKQLSDDLRPVIMVGDGVNDAPSLAIADIGIAMGAHGATAASETADAVILKDDLEKVSIAVKISKDTMKIAKQSVLIGILICTVLMLIASTGIIPALFGAVLQEVVDTVSILSSLRAKND